MGKIADLIKSEEFYFGIIKNNKPAIGITDQVDLVII
jgi:hypothetical protein